MINDFLNADRKMVKGYCFRFFVLGWVEVKY